MLLYDKSPNISKNIWRFQKKVVPLHPLNQSVTSFTLEDKVWFRSSVGLEQQPSKLWVLGSNPNGITIKSKLKSKGKWWEVERFSHHFFSFNYL